MDKIVNHLRQHTLLALTQSRAEALSNPDTVGNKVPDARSGGAELSLPPALRQLYALQQSPEALKSELGQLLSREPHARLLTLLHQQLSLPAEKISQPQQLRQLVSDWFALNPAGALSQPPAARSGSWLQTLPPTLLLVLFSSLNQKSVQAPLGQLARATLKSLGGSDGVGTVLSPSLLKQLIGSLNQIRLSQIHLADTSTALQPEYYLVMPYQSEQQPRQLEILLRKRFENQKGQHKTPFWLFTLRLTAGKAGPVLIKGRWETEHTQLRFYTKNEISCRWLRRALPRLESRLSEQGLNALDAEVHVGRIPDTLAPQPAELRKGYV